MTEKQYDGGRLMEGIYRGSPDGRYRFVLWRSVNMMFGQGLVNFVMLNPSTADDTSNDSTITRCVGYAYAWEYKGLYVTNLSPLRATDPKDMLAAGPEPPIIWNENLDWIVKIAHFCDLVVLAYGADGLHEGRAEKVLARLAEEKISLHCLRVNQDGTPGHPLYLRKDLMYRPYDPNSPAKV